MSVCVPIAVVNAWMRFEQQHLALAIRGRLLDWVHHRYLDQHFTYYRLSQFGPGRLTTIDQRCTQDLDEFTSGTIELFGNILKPLTEILLYARKITQNLGGTQVFDTYIVSCCVRRSAQNRGPS